MTAIYRNDFTIWLMKTAFWAIFTFFSLEVQFLAIIRYLRPDRVHHVYRTKMMEMALPTLCILF